MKWVRQGSSMTLETGLASEKEIPPFSLSTKQAYAVPIGRTEKEEKQFPNVTRKELYYPLYPGDYRLPTEEP